MNKDIPHEIFLEWEGITEELEYWVHNCTEAQLTILFAAIRKATDSIADKMPQVIED